MPDQASRERLDLDDGNLAVEDPRELSGDDLLGLDDAALALREALELGQQRLHILLGLLRLGGQPGQPRDVPVAHEEFHDVHIVLQPSSATPLSTQVRQGVQSFQISGKVLWSNIMLMR